MIVVSLPLVMPPASRTARPRAGGLTQRRPPGSGAGSPPPPPRPAPPGPPRGGPAALVGQRLVLGARLVLHGQRLRVVRAAALDGLLSLLGGGFQLGVREVLEQPADVLGRVTGEVGASEGLGQHGGLLDGCGGVRGDDREENLAGVGRKLGQQPFGGVEFGGVGGGVDDGDHRVEAGAGHVVRVPVAGAVRRGVVGREDEAGAYRVTGVVDGEDGRAGGGGVADLGAGPEGVLQSGAQAQGRVHQLLEAEDEHPALAGAVAQRVRDPLRHVRERRFERGAVGRGEAVPAAVGNAHGPGEVDAGDRGGVSGGFMDRAGLLRLLGRDQGLAAFQYAVRERDRARGAGHQVDAGADLDGEGGQPVAVGRGTHVDQRDDDVAVARVQLVQGPDGVEHGVAGGELVVDQHQGGGDRSLGQQCGVLGQQQVRGGVRVGLLEAARLPDSRHRAPGGVQVRGVPEAVRDGVAETGGRLRVSEDHRAAGLLRAEESPDPLTEAVSRPVHDGGPLGHMLAQHVGDEQVRPLGVAAQGQAQQFPQFSVALEADSEPLGHPVARPHHVHVLFSRRALAHRRALSSSGRRPAGPRSRRLPSPLRRPRPAGACARPRPGGVSLRSSCSCTPSGAPRRPRARGSGCPGRR
ncbi:hypothetical protein SBADM41S_12320 [Streptomyces badius]